MLCLFQPNTIEMENDLHNKMIEFQSSSDYIYKLNFVPEDA